MVNLITHHKSPSRTRLAVLLVLILLFGLGGSVLAEGLPHVVDLAGSFSQAETVQLENEAQALGERFQMDIVIVTTLDAEGKSARAYADDFYDGYGYGVGDEYDGILFLIDFDNREIYISTSGLAIRYLTDARIDSILDDAYNGGMSDSNYYAAAQAFLASTGAYLDAGIPGDQYNEPEKSPNTLTWPEAAGGFAGSSLLALWFFAGTRGSYRGKPRASAFDYRENSLVSMSVMADNLVNSHVTSRTIPRTPTGGGSSSGGRSSTHTSSGGRTHGGGGRRF